METGAEKLTIVKLNAYIGLEFFSTFGLGLQTVWLFINTTVLLQINSRISQS